jgi:hypothetical protein
MIILYIIFVIVIISIWYFFIKPNCPKCHRGRLSRSATGWGKKAECSYCFEIIDVDWL